VPSGAAGWYPLRYLPIIAVRYPCAWRAVAKVWDSSPCPWKNPKPPSLPPLVNTPVSCGNRPVKMDERDGQHSESVTV
jgi:hypothetical protein